MRIAAVVLSSLAFTFIAPTHAQLPALTKNMLTKDELRACMLLSQKNEKEALSIKADQDSFLRDHNGLKTEQAEIAKTNETLNAQSNALANDRRALEAKSDELKKMLETAKTDDEKAAYETQRKAAQVQADQYDSTRVAHFAAQEKHNERVKAFNAKIGDINARNKSVNERVAPHQKNVSDWNAVCQNRRFFEDEEAEIKKELKM